MADFVNAFHGSNYDSLLYVLWNNCDRIQKPNTEKEYKIPTTFGVRLVFFYLFMLHKEIMIWALCQNSNLNNG